MKKPIRPTLGILALLLAILGLVASIFGSDIAEKIQPTPPVEEKVADLVIKVKDAVVAKLKNRDAVIVAPERDWHVIMYKTAMGLGMLSLIAAAISYAKGEPRSYAVSAAGLGVVALAWQALMISFGAIVFFIVIFAVLNFLGIDLSF